MNRRVILSLLFTLAVASASAAYAVNIPSNQGTGQDGFVYAGAPIAVSPLYPVIPTGKTQGGAHDTEGLVQFDLSTVSYTAAQVTSATLNLWVTDVTPTGFGQNPTPSTPVQVNAYAALATWSRATVQWSTKPAIGSLLASVSVDGIGKWVSVDVTSQVQSWLANPATNFGLLLSANAIVGGPGNYTIPAFSSGFGAQSANAPYLSVVPEPPGLLLALGVLPVAVLAFRRRRTM